MDVFSCSTVLHRSRKSIFSPAASSTDQEGTYTLLPRPPRGRVFPPTVSPMVRKGVCALLPHTPPFTREHVPSRGVHHDSEGSVCPPAVPPSVRGGAAAVCASAAVSLYYQPASSYHHCHRSRRPFTGMLFACGWADIGAVLPAPAALPIRVLSAASRLTCDVSATRRRLVGAAGVGAGGLHGRC